MIKAVYHRKYHRLTLEGHAGGGEAGNDLICSAASILCYTFASVVKNAADAQMVRDIRINLEVGQSEVSCKPVYRYGKILTIQMDAVCGGFELLARQYPDNISYKIIS